MLKDFKDGKEQNLGEKDLDGKKVTVFKITRPMPQAADMSKPTDLTLWVDPSTDLPVQALATFDGHDSYLKNLEFGTDLGDSLFDTTIPAGFQTQNMGGISSDKLKPAPTTQHQAADLFTLTPNVGIWNARLRRLKEKVIQILDQAQRQASSPSGHGLSLHSRCACLLVSPKAGLMSIRAMSKKSAGPFAMNEDFAGQTDKGISIGATRARDRNRLWQTFQCHRARTRYGHARI